MDIIKPVQYLWQKLLRPSDSYISEIYCCFCDTVSQSINIHVVDPCHWCYAVVNYKPWAYLQVFVKKGNMPWHGITTTVNNFIRRRVSRIMTIVTWTRVHHVHKWMLDGFSLNLCTWTCTWKLDDSNWNASDWYLYTSFKLWISPLLLSTHRGRVANKCVSYLRHHWFRWWLVACSSPSHYRK